MVGQKLPEIHSRRPGRAVRESPSDRERPPPLNSIALNCPYLWTVGGVFSLSIVPGQENNPIFTAGTIPVGTRLDVPVSIVDQEIATVRFHVEFKTPDMTGVETLSALLNDADYELETALSADQAAVYRFHYDAAFSAPIVGASAAEFLADRAGTYAFVVKATDGDGNETTRRQAITVVNQEDLLEGVEGAPFVTELLPDVDAVDVMVTAPIIATFSEPVINVDTSTFTLTDITDEMNPVAVEALVYVSVEGGRMRGILQPKHNLHYGRIYKAELTDGITDAHVNNEGENKDKHLPLDLTNKTVTTFTTKQPKTYRLPQEERFYNGTDIVLYERGAKTYAIVAAQDEGWHILDVSDPSKPRKLFEQDLEGAMYWQIKSVAVNRDNGLLAYTESVRYSSGDHFGNVNFVDLNDLLARLDSGETVGTVYPVGRVRLAESYSSIPGRVVMNNDHAYVMSVNVGIQVVDIKMALEATRPGTGSSNEAIVGVYPNDPDEGRASTLNLYSDNKALLGTSGGYLVALDLSFAQMPRRTAALLPKFPVEEENAESPADEPSSLHVTHFDAVKEYTYLTEDGLNESIDLAVVATREGQLLTIDITDPYGLKVLSAAYDENDQLVTGTLARDVVIAKDSGLVFVTGFGTIQVFDIKDPLNPLLLDTITRMPDADGNLIPLGAIDDLVEKGGWLILIRCC